MKRQVLYFSLATIVSAIFISGIVLAQPFKTKYASGFKNSEEYKAALLRQDSERQLRLSKLKAKTKIIESYTDQSGNTAVLYDVDKSGLPVYRKTFNGPSAITIAVNTVRPGTQPGYNLTGLGYTAGIWDGGATRTTHTEFSFQRARQRDNATALSNHATHVTGTVGAKGLSTQNNSTGMAPEANLDCYDWSLDIYEMLAAAQNGLLTSNHSYGTVHGWSGGGNNWVWHGPPTASEDPAFGLYDINARQLDEVTYEMSYYLPVIASGNDRNDGPNTPGATHTLAGTGSTSNIPRTKNGPYNIVSGFSCAKNGLSVGAVNGSSQPYSGTSSIVMTSFSNWGPTDDGRIKPDLVADGSNVYSTSSSGESGYTTMSGTSMAAPSVTGGIVLVQQQYAQHNNMKPAKSEMVRALLYHSAFEAGTSPGPDYSYGWGQANIKGAADLIANNGKSSLVYQDTLRNGATKTFDFSGQGNIKATIAWRDPEASLPPSTLNSRKRMLVNDLDIRLVDNLGNTYMPWVLDPEAPAAAAYKGDNIIDNAEQIVFENAPAGQYRIVVSHKDTLMYNMSEFAMVITGLAQTNFAYCNEKIFASSLTGTIGDGSGTATYQPNTNCKWIITAPDDRYTVFADFTYLSLGTGDTLFAYDGDKDSTGSYLLKYYTAGSSITWLKSNSKQLTFHLKSDATDEAQGFTINYRLLMKPQIEPAILDKIICPNDFANLEARVLNQDTALTNFTWTSLNSSTVSVSGQFVSMYFNTGGWQDIRLEATSFAGSTTLFIPRAILVKPLQAFNTAPYFEGFDNLPGYPINPIDSNGNFVLNTTFTGNNPNWELTTDAAISGSRSLRIRNRGLLNNNIREIESPTYDLSNLPAQDYMSFSYAYARRSTSSNDQFDVFFSTNCGKTWDPVLTLDNNSNPSLSSIGMADSNVVTATNFIPTANEWQSMNILLPSRASNFKFKFKMTNRTGHTMYIDDIKIGLAAQGNRILNSPERKAWLVPNPSNGSDTKLIMQTSEGEGYNIVITDALGRVAQIIDGLAQSDNTEIGLAKFAKSGLYMVNVRYGNGSSSITKLIVN